MTNGVTNERVRTLSATRTVAVSALWNLVGRIGPILIALAATPVLVRDLGVARWGVFTIALSLVGMFGILDLGLSRAMTRSVSERIGAGDEASAASVVRTGLVAVAGFGVAGGLVGALAMTLWVRHGLDIDPSTQREVLLSFYVLSAMAPFVILSSAMWGVIGAYQKFRAANLLNIPLQFLYYLGPLAVLQAWDSLIGVVLVLLLCRIVFTLIYWRLCLRIMPALRSARPSLSELRPLLHLGSWMSVSNITWPILMYADRFLIASVLTASATAYYTTPFDVMSRFAIVSIAITTSLYPAMSVSFRTDPAVTTTLFRRGLLVMGTILLPVCLVAASFSHAIMEAWLGLGFATQSGPILRWLALGALMTGLDGVPAGLIDAVGRPDLNAKLSLGELAVSVPLLLVLLHWFGIEGAAFTWTLRCCADFGLRLFLAARCYPAARPAIARVIPTLTVAAAAVLLAPIGGIFTRTAVTTGTLFVYLLLLWRSSLEPSERAWLLAQLQRHTWPRLRPAQAGPGFPIQ